MKLLTFAHRGEAQAFLSAYSFKPVDFFFDGLLKSDEYYLLITGEGPHSASEKTISVLAKLNTEITEVYNLGVAGSLNPKLKKFDLIWIRTAYAHHAEKCEFKSYSSNSAKAANDCMTAFSRVLDLTEKKKLSHFANIVDRELWAVASAANLFKKPYSALKIISDEMVEAELDICKFVKEEAPLYSEKLLNEFQNHRENKIQKIEPIKSDSPFLRDPAFYFTTSQIRKLNSTLDGLRLKGLSLPSLIKEPTIINIKDLELLPKERTRLLLEFLGEKLNPISVKIKASIKDSLSPLHDAKILTTNDPEFEENWLNLSMKIQSSRDLEKIKNALKIFSYEDFKKIFDGNFDV
jgi:nucleoside phosphorylase